MSTSTRVVTYAHAYLADSTIELCPRHDADHPTVRRIFGPVGPVQHGSHRGTCDACLDDDVQRVLAAQRTAAAAR